MAKKEKQNTKKKIDWKKVLTLVVIVALIVLKLMYGSDGNEDGDGQNAGSAGVESSIEVGIAEGDNSSASLPVADSGAVVTDAPEPEIVIPDLSFRNNKLLEQHYEKHGIDMGFSSPEEYEAAACLVIANPDTLHKIEAEDGDDVYYLESTNEFVVVSKDGYIRTYFLPSAGIDYYNRQ